MPSGDAARPIGSIEIVYGTATAAFGDESRFLAKGDPVFKGEIISTGQDSALEIRFTDDTVLSQNQNSIVNLDTYVFDPDSGAGDTTALTVADNFEFQAQGSFGKTDFTAPSASLNRLGACP